MKQRGVYERDEGSGVYWIRYSAHGRIRREKVGTKQEAIDRYQQRKVEARNGVLPARNRDVLLSEFVIEYLATEKHRMRSFRNYERHGKVWSERFKGRTLRSILPLDIERWITRRASDGSMPATINRELSFLRRVFNVAMANDLVERNPFKRIKLLRENNARVRWLTEDEEARLRKEVGDEAHWALVGFALHTGLRQGEQFRLRWHDVDLVNLVLTVPRSKHGEARHVHLNETAVAILRAAPSRCASPWVFPSRTNATPLEPHNFLNRVFAPAVKRAGISNFRWHDIRHTFASRLVMAGVDLATVKELMGHKTLAMTLRYAHLSTAHRVAAVRMLDAPTPTPPDANCQTDTELTPTSTTGAA